MVVFVVIQMTNQFLYKKIILNFNLSTTFVFIKYIKLYWVSKNLNLFDTLYQNIFKFFRSLTSNDFICIMILRIISHIKNCIGYPKI